MRSTFAAILSLTLAACAAHTPSPTAPLATLTPIPTVTLIPSATPQVISTRLMAELRGQLVRVGECLRVQSAYTPESFLLVWPADFEARVSGQTVLVADLIENKQLTWHVGDTIDIAGGIIPRLDASLRPVPAACAGPYWLVGSVEPSQTPTPLAVTPAAPPTPTPAQPGVTQQANGNVVTFTSTALGLSFSYQPSQRGATVATRVVGQRVYLYYTDLPPLEGQYVEVLRKAPGESLQQAIQQQILTSFDPQDCSLTTQVPEVSEFPHPPTLVYLTIQPRVPPTVSAADDDIATAAAQAQKCPQPYTMFGGSAYFMADSAHPDRFFFFKIGQDVILGAEGYPWQDTLRVIDIQ